jgi:S-adenosylmethionine:tRNA-ribosyltransferase-isomerase (queuine synthetase)
MRCATQSAYPSSHRDTGGAYRTDDPYALMERHGHVPLPPYIKRQQ